MVIMIKQTSSNADFEKELHALEQKHEKLTKRFEVESLKAERDWKTASERKVSVENLRSEIADLVKEIEDKQKHDPNEVSSALQTVMEYKLADVDLTDSVTQSKILYAFQSGLLDDIDADTLNEYISVDADGESLEDK